MNDLIDAYTDGLVAGIREREREAVIRHLRDRLRLARSARRAAKQTPPTGLTYYTTGYADALATAIEALER